MSVGRKPESVLSAGKRLGERSGWTLTNLQMQKMTYIAHMYCLGVHEIPLVSGTFEAWDLGPVHPMLYHMLKGYGAKPIRPGGLFMAADLSDDYLGVDILDQAVDFLDRRELVNITHWKYGAWAKNYDPTFRGVLIPNRDILEEYRLRVERYEEEQRAGQ